MSTIRITVDDNAPEFLDLLEIFKARYAEMAESREFNRNRVVVLEDELERIRSSRASADLPSRNLYTDEEMAAAQASETELVAAPLRAKIEDLRSALKLAADARDTWINGCTSAQATITELTNRTRELNRDRHTEKARADEAESRVEVLTGQLSVAQQKAERAEGLDRDRIKYLEVALGEARQKAETLSDELDKMADRCDELARDITRMSTRLTLQLNTVTNERDQARRELDAAKTIQNLAERGIEAKDHQLTRATTRIKSALEILRSARVAEAGERTVTPSGAILADAIENALTALES